MSVRRDTVESKTMLRFVHSERLYLFGKQVAEDINQQRSQFHLTQ